MGVVFIPLNKGIMDEIGDRDTSIRIKKETKSKLDELDFVTKSDSYNSIIIDLIDFYKDIIEEKKGDDEGTLHERTN